MFCLGLLGFLHGLPVRMYRLSPIPISLPHLPHCTFPLSLPGKVNRPKHSSPFLVVAHCFTIDSNATTFLRRLFFLLCLFTVNTRAALQSSVFIPMYLLMSTCQPSAHLFLQIPDYYAFLLVFLCVPSHPPRPFCFLGAS